MKKKLKQKQVIKDDDLISVAEVDHMMQAGLDLMMQIFVESAICRKYHKKSIKKNPK